MSDKPDGPVASRILVVEDEAIFAKDLSLTLQDLGYEVIGTVRTGELALQLTEESKPDLILMDIKLAGEIDGIQASVEIRARFDIPIIFITAHGEMGVISRAKVTEPYGFLTKPISHNILKNTIETALYKHEADKLVRESEERYRTLVEQSVDGIGLIEGTTVRFANRALARLFGFQSPLDIVGQDILFFVAPEYRDLMEKRGRDLEAGKSVTDYYEFTALRKDGTPFDAELRASLTTYQGEGIRQWIIRDISERKKAEEVIHQNEARTAKAEELAGLFSWEWDIGTGRLIRSEGSCHAYGFHSGVTDVDMDSFFNSVHVEDRHLVQKALGDAVDGVRSYDVEYRIVRPDGAERVLHSRGEVERGEKGRAIRMLGMSLDITDRKKAEEALRESEVLLRSTQQIAHVGSWQFDLSTNHLSWSDEVYRIFGVEPQEFRATYEDFLERVHPEDRSAVDAAYSLGKDRDSYEIEHRIVKQGSGEVRHVHEKCRHIRDSAGGIIRSVGMVQDITDRKKAEEKLRSEKEKFQILCESAPFGMVVIAEDGTFEYINPKFKEIFGYDLNDVPNGREWFRKAYPDPRYRHQIISDWKQNVLGQAPGEARPLVIVANCKDGNQKVVDCRPVKLDTGEALMVCEDITERTRSEEEIKRAQVALRDSEERLKSVMASMDDLLFVLDPTGRFVDCYLEPEKLDRLYLPAAEFLNKHYRDVLPVQVADLLESSLHALEASEKTQGFDYSMKIAQETHWFSARVSTLKGHNGDVNGFTVVARNITGRKKTEEALRESEERYRQLAEVTFEGIIFHEGGKLVHANQQYYEMHGYSKEDLEGKQVVPLTIAPESRETAMWHIESDSTTPYEIIAMRKDGTRFPAEVQVQMKEINGRKLRVTALRDVSARNESERALRESEAKYRALIETTDTGYLIADTQGRVLDANEEYVRLTGHSTLEEIKGRSVLEWTAEYHRERNSRALKQCIAKAFIRNLEIDYVDEQGCVIPTEINATAMSGTKSGMQIIGLCRDVTYHKMIENRLRASLNEKEVLVKEVHHRVKNNLSIVASLANLERRMYAKNDREIKLLEDIGRRILSMSTAYELLYRSDNLSEVNVPRYIGSLMSDLGCLGV